MNMVDSCGWIEYFEGGENAGFFSPPIRNSAELIVPVISIYEVFKKICLVVDEKRALEAISQMCDGHIIELTSSLAISAALLSIDKKLPMADALIYATAKEYGAELWTQDEHLKDLPGVHYKPGR